MSHLSSSPGWGRRAGPAVLALAVLAIGATGASPARARALCDDRPCPPSTPATVPCNNAGDGRHDCSFHTLGDGRSGGTAVQALDGKIRSTIPPLPSPPATYVALGDSYSSGLGTFDYDLGRRCGRSSQAYPPLVASQLGYDLISFAACSGATTDDVLKNQLGGLSGKPKYVTISVGGNDADFTGVVSDCLLVALKCARHIRRARQVIQSELPARLDAVYSAIRSKADAAAVVVVGYPHLFKGPCAGLLNPTAADEKRLNSAADLLDDVIKREAAKARFRFVDPRSPFDDHAVCGHPPWLNGP